MRRAPLAALAVVLAASAACAGEAVIRGQDARLRTARLAFPASGGGWKLHTDGGVGDWIVVKSDRTITVIVRAAGEPAAGVFPKANLVVVDPAGKRRVAKSFAVDSRDFRDYACEIAVGKGTVGILVEFINDHYNSAKNEDRNLIVREIRVKGAAMAPGNPLDALTDQRIRKHRTAEVTLTVTDADGKPLADTKVTVRMTRHKFLFGCNIFKLFRCRTPEDNAAYAKRFRELLNFATLGFYWSGYEATEGQPEFERWRKVAAWCAEHGIRTKGHPLLWSHEPRWLLKKTPAQAEALQWARIEREIKAFAGLIDTWDVLNEPCVGARQARQRNAQNSLRLYTEHGAVWTILRAFEHARKAGPKATLILNDYNTSPAYEKIIRDVLAQGASVDVIGIQSHMHGGAWSRERTWGVCERFAKFGKPLHFTEATVVSGPRTPQGWNTTPEGEKRQARQVVAFYRTLFSHPAVEAITWWDFSDQGAWQRAPAGLVRKDMSPKPIYLALKDLIKKQWWTGPLELKTDAAGRVTFRGFLGHYVIVANGRKAAFSLGKAGTAILTGALAEPAR